MLFRSYKFSELVAQHEREQWPAEMEAMERQVNILTDALANEREECAKICETYADIDTTPDGVCDNYHAYLIRQRSKE